MFVFCDKEIIFVGTKTSNKFVMHRLIFLITLFWFLFPSISINAQSSGEGLYKADCSACHTINGGRLIGPDLAGINELRGTISVNFFHPLVSKNDQIRRFARCGNL